MVGTIIVGAMAHRLYSVKDRHGQAQILLSSKKMSPKISTNSKEASTKRTKRKPWFQVHQEPLRPSRQA